ncbi:ribonuclease HI family protein [Candidatus Uhrbacteria bacterium]|jgi:ribonuclease HI|nr:ribonuclease HI family protein [Candidatus Uhrbacteria bacterium]
MKAVLYGDGGSRGNPGPAASGVVLFDEDDEVIAEANRFLGTQTNNYAEYTAIIIGLELAIAHDIDELTVRLDSELAVKQLKGEYRVKNETLARLYLQVINLTHQFKSIEFQHVRREKNKHADGLVNKALDEAAR